MRTRNRLTQLLVSSALLLATTASAQVTIGSNDVPVHGALLQLKETNAVGANSKQGLGMPRVLLSDLTKLIMSGTEITDAQDGGSQYEKHIGLIVYHTDKCTLNGKGLYVWTGALWNKLGASNPYRLTLDKTRFDLPSGYDARGAVTTQMLNATWQGALAPTWTLATSTGFTDGVSLTAPSGTAGTVGTSPYSMAITPSNIQGSAPSATSPWIASKQSDFTFTDQECGGTQTVTINQTHYALMAKGTTNSSQVVYKIATDGQFEVKSNAKWKATITANIGTPSITPATGGDNIDNYPTRAINTQSVVYNPASVTNYTIADVTFSDAESPKRFNDVVVSFLHCNSSQNDLSMNAWAIRAGFTQAEIDGIGAGETLGGSTPVTRGKDIQLHKDQSSNVFLSGVFGDDSNSSDGKNRWMLNNLAAKTFATTGRTGTDVNVSQTLIQNDGTKAYYKTMWENPNRDATLFANNPRLGLLYNWAAATNAKGSTDATGTQTNTTGTTTINDGEGDANPQSDRRQGICPNGWHLPSDREWTALEQEITTNTSNYSSQANIGGTLALGGSSRGSHGLAIQDPCPTPKQATNPNAYGKSNTINSSSTVAPGFNVLLAGLGDGSLAAYYGSYGYFWLAGGRNNIGGWSRLYLYGYSSGGRTPNDRNSLFSVRCKKD